ATIGEPVLAMALSGRAVPPPRETPPVPIDPARAREVSGAYVLERVEPAKEAEPLRAREGPAPPRLGLAWAGERLALAPERGAAVRLFAAEDGAFFPKQLGVRVSFDEGRLTLDRFGRKMVYRRADR